jgi:hypothetical protein
MKVLLKVGDQLDLNVAYNGAAADSGLTYVAPENNGIISVNLSNGVVTALATGESVVRVYSGNPSVQIATVVCEVVSVAQYAEYAAIREGINPVTFAAQAVPQGPQLSRFSPMGLTALEQDGFKLNWVGIAYGGMWVNVGYPEMDALKFFDNNTATGFSNTTDNAWPRRNMLLIIPPTSKKFKKIEVDRNQITGGHTIQVFGRNGSLARNYEGSWTELCNFSLNDNSSFELPDDSIAYSAYQVQHYSHYNSGIYISEIRLYGTN